MALTDSYINDLQRQAGVFDEPEEDDELDDEDYYEDEDDWDEEEDDLDDDAA